MISFKPSIRSSSSSGSTRPAFLPSRLTDSVRTWLILTHDCLGNATLVSSSESGKPAFCGWLVTAMAITVPDRSLNTSWLGTTPGRRPACSRPLTGSRSAHTRSPLSIRAILQHPPPDLPLPTPAHIEHPASQSPESGACDPGGSASRPPPPEWLHFYHGI